MKVTHVKICSVQEIEHALAAARAGADYVGFNFVPGARRHLPEEKARRMVQAFRQAYPAGGLKLVGIFADQPVEEMNRILEACDLDMAQLSGHEPLEYCQGVARPTIKAVHVDATDDLARLHALLAELEQAGILPLLEPQVAGSYGGTGQMVDWGLARELAASHRFLLAGGLTPENVARAIREVRPWGVDVSSGVETNGVKDLQKIGAFIRQAREAFALTHQREKE
ncbi:MAG: phosphoribosylanthranilate isomerase [Chloroflexi bacterium]|nr:phosphoribosylanthranilate isomerase [Chloroflexota bacterium]